MAWSEARHEAVVSSAAGSRRGARIHVAGNAVIDLLLPDSPSAADGVADGWSEENVRFLEGPPDCVIGGNGGAIAYLLGRLGNQVSLNTRIGNDAFGDMLRTWFDDAGVELCGRPARTTAVNTILLPGDGTRRSLYYTGDRVEWRQSAKVAACDWFYASGYGQVTADDLVELTEVFSRLRAKGSRIAFDPGPWFLAASDPEIMMRSWQQTDCLMGTEEELGAGCSSSDVQDVIREILEEGVPAVVVKRGSLGAAYGTAAADSGVQPAEAISASNTVGAGDTFNAGLIHRLAAGDAVDEAVVFGLEVAARAVRSGRGALGALGDAAPI